MKLKRSYLWVVLVLLVFAITRLLYLNKLPVFADEAIYIRWAQLMNQDFARYALFPLQDGKPPLHMMVLTRFLPLFPLDPLLASRLMSGVAGLFTMILFVVLVKQLNGSRRAQIMTALLYIFLPFTLFHDRMGLIDAMLLMWSTATFLSFVMITRTKGWLWPVLAGLSYGAALWTKSPAMFFIPVIMVFYALMAWSNRKKARFWLVRFVVAGLIAVGIFGLLKLSPTFASLLSRSEDFTFSLVEVLSGTVSHVPGNVYRLIVWLGAYLTPPLLLLLFITPLFYKKFGKYYFNIVWLGLFALIFAAPIIVLGKVVAARYYLPMMVFLLPMIAIVLDELVKAKLILGVLVVVLSGIYMLRFDVPLILSPEKTPLTSGDKEQYLTSWSAGYGIKEVRDFINQKAGSKRVVVVTEGYFGTLPDGLLMYFDKSPMIRNIEIFGIGQPVRELKDEVTNKAKVDETYLVVNEHRLLMEDQSMLELVNRYPRPLDGPDLLLLRIETNEEN
jgi:4-amino-4-deoxy-L-arabinose transferase-like glycosyltransferase